MYCNKCGREIPDNSLFCPFCGKDLSDVNDMLTEERVRQSTAVKPDISNNELKNENVRAKRLGIPEEDATVKPKRNVILISLLLISMVAVAIVLMPRLIPKSEPTIPLSEDAEALDTIAKSVVYINCYDSEDQLLATGSGFVAYNDQTIISNYHVVEGIDHVEVVTDEGVIYETEQFPVLNEEYDVSIMHLSESTGLTPIPFGDSTNLKKGQKVVAIGSPLSLQNTISTGIISNFITYQDGSFDIQTSAPISHGSSGGALLNEEGEVIGITYASYEGGQSLNLAIPIHLADKIYNEYIQKSFSAEESGENTASSSSDVEQEKAQLEEYVIVKDIEGLEYRIPSGWDDAVISRNGANTYSIGNATLTISYKPINIGVYKQEGSDLEVCKMLYEEYISRLKTAGFQVREDYVNYSQSGKAVVGTMNFARIKNNEVANFTALISTSYTDAYLLVYSVKDGFVVEDEFKKQVQEVFDSVKVVAKED